MHWKHIWLFKQQHWRRSKKLHNPNKQHNTNLSCFFSPTKCDESSLKAIKVQNEYKTSGWRGLGLWGGSERFVTKVNWTWEHRWKEKRWNWKKNCPRKRRRRRSRAKNANLIKLMPMSENRAHFGMRLQIVTSARDLRQVAKSVSRWDEIMANLKFSRLIHSSPPQPAAADFCTLHIVRSEVSTLVWYNGVCHPDINVWPSFFFAFA